MILNEDGEVMYSKKGERIGKSVEEEKGEKEYKKIRTEMEKGKAFYLLEKEKNGGNEANLLCSNGCDGKYLVDYAFPE